MDSDSNQTDSSTSVLEQDQADTSQLLASITSYDDSLLKAKETSLVTFQMCPAPCFTSSAHQAGPQVSCLHKERHVIEATPRLNSITINLKLHVHYESALGRICIESRSENLRAVRTEPSRIECSFNAHWIACADTP